MFEHISTRVEVAFKEVNLNLDKITDSSKEFIETLKEASKVAA